ncbi:MAG TPA: homoserine O-acetyltransferase, partial [Longimicrobium sp.]|nr:homoserine O-acetyltransferase [Longimicrobium sp.]
FAEMIGSVPYADMVWVRSEMIGEWTFAGAAFPEFAADHDDYLARINATYAAGDEAEAGRIRDFLWRIRRKAEAFIDRTAREVLATRPRIVGCSSTFNQHCAALALTRRIKALDPSVVTVLGGGNCEGEMGLATVQQFPWVDYVVSGEADELFPAFCRRVLEEGPPQTLAELPLGVLGPPHRVHAADFLDAASVPRASVERLDRSPVPDFDDYFAGLDAFAYRAEVTPGLLIETSRGCWWGMVKHCTFCGLNGGGMSYRAKSPDRAISEFRYLALRYGVSRFLVVDNILDLRYFEEVMPALAKAPEELTLFYEIKANVTFEQLQLLRAAGATWLQPGIESLHDDALKLMRKGTQSWINVQLLKWARQLGLSIGWNILCGFPGESDDWYGEMAEWVPLIQHLQPTTELRPIRFDRFSPYQADPAAHGLKLKPAWPYAYIYPLEDAALARLVYAFEAVDRPAQYTNSLRLRFKEEYPSLGGPGRDLLQQRIREWHDGFLSPLPPVLCMEEEAEETTILDTRSVATETRVVLRGLAHRVHRSLFAAHSTAQVAEALAGDGGPAVDAAEVEAALEELAARKLVLRLGSRWLALAIAGDVPVLPRSHREGYPGGWVRRPPPKRAPRQAQAPGPERRATLVLPQSARFREPLPLDCGRTLNDYTIAYETYGTLSPARDNAVLVCHPLTKDGHLAGRHAPGDARPGWWDAAVGPGRMLDTERFFVISSNVLGGSGGSTGPASVDPATGKPYGMDFPVLTVGDMVRAQKQLAESLGIERFFAIVGGCFGGEQALEWAVRYPDAVANVVAISATAATSAHTVAVFHVMRRLIRRDPDWNGGSYYGKNFPLRGLSDALVAAVPLWMSREAMEARFGRRMAGEGDGYGYSLDSEFAVEEYLDGVGGRPERRIDPNSLLYLTRAVEYFDLGREPGGLEAALAKVRARVLLVSYRGDWRYPADEVDLIRELLERQGGDATHVVLDHPLGHGAFVHDPDATAPAVRAFLAEAEAEAAARVEALALDG